MAVEFGIEVDALERTKVWLIDTEINYKDYMYVRNDNSVTNSQIHLYEIYKQHLKAKRKPKPNLKQQQENNTMTKNNQTSTPEWHGKTCASCAWAYRYHDYFECRRIRWQDHDGTQYANDMPACPAFVLRDE
jgi:hypothetical protein